MRGSRTHRAYDQSGAGAERTGAPSIRDINQFSDRATDQAVAERGGQSKREERANNDERQTDLVCPRDRRENGSLVQRHDDHQAVRIGARRRKRNKLGPAGIPGGFAGQNRAVPVFDCQDAVGRQVNLDDLLI